MMSWIALGCLKGTQGLSGAKKNVGTWESLNQGAVNILDENFGVHPRPIQSEYRNVSKKTVGCRWVLVVTKLFSIAVNDSDAKESVSGCS